MKKNLGGVLLFMVLLFISSEPQEARACSGYPYFGIEDLPTMELLVRATVIDTDDRGYNAVLRIEDYYKGEGSRFVAVMRYSPAVSAGALLRGYDTGCLYAGLGHHFRRGTQGYFGLKSNGDGTFTDSNGGSAHFYAVDGMITYEEGATEGFAVELDDPYTIPEAEFIDLMLQAGNRTAPVPPNGESDYPLMRFLTITTENGTQYQVNPDRSVMPLPEDGPLAISPDGAHVAFRLDEGRIGFQYIWKQNRIVEDEALINEWEFSGVIVEGEAVRFSNDSSFVAVWNQTQMTIYMLTNFSGSDYGNWLELHEVARVNLVDKKPLPAVVWSGDSTTVVWVDGNGLWHWNLVEEADAKQLLTGAEMSSINETVAAVLLDVSQHGRFVRVGVAGEWVLIDAETGEQHQNTIVSPDERFLMVLDGGVVRRPEERCVPPLRETCVLPTQLPVDTYFFYDVNLVGIVDCFGDPTACTIKGLSWNPSIGVTRYVGGRLLGRTIEDMRQLVFDYQYDQVAILVGDYEIFFDFYTQRASDFEEWRPYLDILDLKDQLDSAIVSIEWGQPMFYDMYYLANAEDIP